MTNKKKNSAQEDERKMEDVLFIFQHVSLWQLFVGSCSQLTTHRTEETYTKSKTNVMSCHHILVKVMEICVRFDKFKYLTVKDVLWCGLLKFDVPY